MTMANGRHEPVAARPPKVGIVIRLLLYLSTTAWRDDMQLAKSVRSYLLDLKKAGWLVREASPRNFTIWRSEITYSGTSGIIVLPSTSVSLNGKERSAIAIDVLEAAGAVRSASEFALSIDDAYHFDNNFQSGMAKIQRALAYGWPIKADNAPWLSRSSFPACGRRKSHRK